MKDIDPKMRKVTPEIVVAKLKEHSQKVTRSETKLILDFIGLQQFIPEVSYDLGMLSTLKPPKS